MNLRKKAEQNLKERIRDFQLALKIYEGGATEKDIKEFNEKFGYMPNEDFDFYEFLNNYALYYGDDDYYRAKRLELSWGGPSDYFLFFENLDIIKYVYLEWGKGTEIDLVGNDYKIMETVKELLNIE